MFNSDKRILLFSTVLAIVIIGSILEGYILHDQINMTLANWKGVILLRLLFHVIGILPLWIFVGMLMESVWKPVVLGSVMLALMNFNPLFDLWYGPLVIDQVEAENCIREEFNNLSSDIDFSTYEVPMIRLEREGRSIMLTEERWKEILRNCGGAKPIRFVGLENLEVELESTCR